MNASGAQQIYREFLSKAGGDWKNGGSVGAAQAIHQLRSGKAVYHPEGPHYAHSFAPKETRKIAQHVRSQYKGFKPADHREAASHHAHESSQTYSTNKPLSESHMRAAIMHEFAARRPRAPKVM